MNRSHQTEQLCQLNELLNRSISIPKFDPEFVENVFLFSGQPCPKATLGSHRFGDRRKVILGSQIFGSRRKATLGCQTFENRRKAMLGSPTFGNL